MGRDRNWVFDLAILLIRKRMFWVSMTPCLASSAVGWLVFMVMASLSLSPQQSVTQTMGGADGILSIGSPATPGSDPQDFIGEEGRTYPRLQTAIVWRGEQRSIALEEMSYPSPVTAGRLELASGRWPQHPGEVALSPELARRIDRPVLSAQTGELTVRVVGVVRSVFQRDLDQVFAAAGTWSSWRLSEQESTQLAARAQRDVFFFGEPPAAIVALATEQGSSVTTREELLNQLSGVSAKTVLERGFAVSLLPPLGALISALLVGRWSRGATRVLSELGASLVGLRVAQASALVLGTLVSALLALGASYGLLVLARDYLNRSATQPLHPWPWIGGLAIASTSASIVVAVITVFGIRRLDRPLAQARLLRARGKRALRFVGLATLVAASLCAVIGGRGFTWLAVIALLVAIAAACLAPMVVMGVSTWGGVPNSRLWACRALISDLRRYSVVMVAGCLITTLAATTFGLAGAAVSYLNNTSSTGVPRGMVMLNANIEGLPPASSEQIAKFNADLGDTPSGVIVRTGISSEGMSGEEWAFADLAQAEATLGPIPGALVDRLVAGEAVHTSVDPLPGKWSVPLDLRSVVQVKVGEPSPGVRFGSALLYSKLSPEQEQIAYLWAEANSLSPAYVVAPSQGERIPIPISAQLSGFGFALVILLMVFGAIRGEVARLRPLLSGIAAIGLGQGWARSGVLWLGGILGFAISLSSVLGTMVGLVLGRALMGSALPVLDAPWPGIVAICSAGLLGALGAGLIASRPRALAC